MGVLPPSGLGVIVSGNSGRLGRLCAIAMNGETA